MCIRCKTPGRGPNSWSCAHAFEVVFSMGLHAGVYALQAEGRGQFETQAPVIQPLCSKTRQDQGVNSSSTVRSMYAIELCKALLFADLRICVNCTLTSTSSYPN